MFKYPKYNNQRAYNFAIQSRLIEKDTKYKNYYLRKLFIIENYQTGLTAKIVRGVFNRYKRDKTAEELKLIFRAAIANKASEILNRNKSVSRDPQKEPAKKTSKKKMKVRDEKKGITYWV